VIRYLLRGFQAHLQSGRSLFVLSVLGVALGVASVSSILILNRSALGAFEGSVRAVSGDADLSVLPLTPTFSERLYPRVLASPDVERAWPLYRVDVALAGADEVYLEVLGLDLFVPRDVPWSEAPRDLGQALTTPGFVAVSPQFARAQELEVGDRFEVTSGSRRVSLYVGALVDFRSLTPLASTTLVVTDIAQAQDLFGRRGELHQIDLTLRSGVDASTAIRRLERRLGPSVRVRAPEQRTAEAAGLLGAFRLNLTALSLISLFVGGFLVYVSTRAVLVRRRGEIGLLRAIGATRAQTLVWILGEVSLLGTLGVGLGLSLGYLAAAANLERISGTLTNLYMLEAVETLDVPPRLLLLSGLLGIGGALAGAIGPALEMSRRNPRSLLAGFVAEERLGRVSGSVACLGLCMLCGVALWCYWVGETWRARGFVLGVALLLTLPLASPYIVRTATRRLSPRGFGLRYGMKALGLRLHSTAFAAAALAVAVSMLIGITLMIGSFRRTVDLWVGETLQADVYVTSESWRRARDAAALDERVIRGLAEQPEVIAVDRLRQFFAYTGERRISVAGVGLASPPGRVPYQLIEGEQGPALEAMQAGAGVLISEPLARKAGLEVGAALEIATPSGPRSFRVVGVAYDYTSELGGAVMSLETMTAAFGRGAISNLALYLQPGTDVQMVVSRMRRQWSDVPLRIRSNRDIRREVLEIFDQTFAVTRLLQVMSLLIAASGVMLTLIVLARERVSELALYRALGARRPQIFRVFLGKGLGIAAFGLGLGAIAGVLLALVLIYLVNRAYFGWTIAVYWPWRAILEQLATILLAALAASIYPALRASRTPATELSRESL